MPASPYTTDLFTARWHVLKGLPVPDGGPRRALLSLLEGTLGPVGTGPTETPPTEPIGEMPASISVKWLVGAGEKLPIIGHGFGAGRLVAYLNGLNLKEQKWRPSQICIHHTTPPSLAQRPNGFETQHMLNLRDFFLSKKPHPWSAGPHWFVDDRACWAFSPMTAPGVHAKAFNKSAIGIEMLGDYDTEDPTTGRGRQVIDRTLSLVRELQQRFGIGEDGIVFHRDDPETTKTCPGRKIPKDWFLKQLRTH